MTTASADAKPSELGQIFNLQKLYTAFEIFAFSMLLVHFRRHFAFEQILAGYIVLFATPLPFILLARRIRTRAFLVTAFAARLVCVFIYLVRPSFPLMLLYYFGNGLVIFYFWVPYNIRYFLLSHSSNRATRAGHLIVVGPILNTFVPVASSLVIAHLGVIYLVVAGTLLGVILIYKASSLPRLDIPYTCRDVLRRSRGLI